MERAEALVRLAPEKYYHAAALPVRPDTVRLQGRFGFMVDSVSTVALFGSRVGINNRRQRPSATHADARSIPGPP